MMICANGPDLHERDKVASHIGRGIMAFLAHQERYPARFSAGIPRRRTKKDDNDFRSALSQLAGHADAVLNDGQDSKEEEGDRRGSVEIDVRKPERVENGDKERANADVDIQQLAEMQKEMLEEVGTYPGITNHVAMPLPDFSLKSMSKHTAWVKKRFVAHKFTTGWEVGQVHSKKTKTKISVDKAIDDEHIEWGVKYAPTDGRKSEFHSHALAKEDYENLWLFVKK